MTTVNQGWLVARREMRERARSRGFRISTLLMLLVVIAMVLLPGLIDTSDTTKNVGITGTSSQVLEHALTSPGDAGDTTMQLHRYISLAAGEQALRD
jgi:ABC-2 type transport system permease protein